MAEDAWLETLKNLPGYQPGKPLPAPIEAQAKEIAATIQSEVAPGGKVEPGQGWLYFAPIPSDLCRCSPFFPMNRRDMEKRDYLEGMVIASNSWGEVKYTGPRLSTYDEDVLLALLALLKAVPPENGAWTYSGPILPILRAMGIKRVGGDNYRRVKSAVRRLSVAGVELQTTKGRWMIASMLTMASGDDKAATLTVTVNPYFGELYAGGLVNLLDLAKRAELSRPVSKALHRFATSHRGAWRGHFLTLAAGINLDLERPHFELRRQIKQAMAELRKVGILGRKSRFEAGDVVVLEVVRSAAKAINS